VAVLVLIGTTGFVVFSEATEDPLQRVDAVVVLAGDHDGREDYGLELARRGLAHAVVLSDPYPASDDFMRNACNACNEAIAGVEVICGRPLAKTTRGEASMVRRLADGRGWRSIIVVSWRFHLPRVRMIFSQCFSDSPDAVTMRAVPRAYRFNLAQWEYTYLYQYGGMVKALAQGHSC
jgi:uncharacterized SAM-binding protein YcdF (DUF218 family)